MKVKAVLFDFDGVIANTLTYHVKAWQKVFSKFGVEIVPRDVFLNEGQFADEIAKILANNKGLSLTDSELKEITQDKREIYRTSTKAKIYPGIREIIKFIKSKNVKVALVTGSVVPNIRPVVGDNFLENFEVVITGDMVRKNKPHPEPYLTAAKKLGVAPENCLVIENAPLGIHSAKQAGMFCMAVKTTIQDDSILKEADIVFQDVSKIPITDLLNE